MTSSPAGINVNNSTVPIAIGNTAISPSTPASLLSSTKETLNVTTLLTTLSSSILTTTVQTNESTMYQRCLGNNTTTACRFAEFIYVLAYLLLAVAFLPQIVHLFHHGSKYIAGISYSWIILRVLAFASLIFAHSFNWLTVFEMIALVCSIIIFVQILTYADNLHRPQRMILIVVCVLVLFSGGGIIFLLKKYPNFLMKLGYVVLAGHMLPQILLNSLLRTAKAVSPLATMFLAMSSALFFASFYTFQESYLYIVASYYAFSFFVFIYLQSIAISDANIHVISRSCHTVLTSGVDIYTGLDANGARASGQEPQMFSIDDLETPDGTDVVYQQTTSNRPANSFDQNRMKEIIWYGTLAAIFAMETTLTIMLIRRTWTPFIIFVPISIALVLGLFHLLRIKLSDIQTELLKKLL